MDWIVVVDDDVTNLKIAGMILSRHNMRVTALRSGMAAELESAADDGRAEDISEGHVRMLRCYAETVQAIRDTFRNGEENVPSGRDSGPNDEEIMEFLPD